VFKKCTADKVKQQELLYGGLVYPNTEIEPYVAVNPRNPLNQIVVTQQDRWSNGGSRGTRGAFSTDGGKTWTASVPVGVSACDGGPYLRSSDPWVSVAPNGVVFVSSLVETPSTVPGLSGSNGEAVNRSFDGGATWGAAKSLIADTDPTILNDKNSITADPTDSAGNLVYVVWDRVGGPVPDPDGGAAPAARSRMDGVGLAELRMRRLRAAAAGAAAAPPLVKGPTYFARTVDGGDRWERAVPIYYPGANAQTTNNIIRVLPTVPTLVEDYLVHIHPNGSAFINLIFSVNSGLTWSKTPIVVTDLQRVPVVTPFAHEQVRAPGIIFSVTDDPGTAAVYVVWLDDRFTRGVNAIAFS
jgi:hypothetical protein